MNNSKGKQHDGLTRLHQRVCVIPTRRFSLLVSDLKGAPLNRWVTLRHSISNPA